MNLIFDQQKWSFRKLYHRKRKHFQYKIKKYLNDSKELQQMLTYLVLKSNKVSQTKITLKNDGAIQLEPTKMQILLKIPTLSQPKHQ